MAGQSIEASSRTGGNLFLRAVALLSTLAGWCSAAMIVGAVAITCQMIFVRFVLNQSTTLVGLPYVQQLRGHVNVDLIPLALPPKARYGMCLLTLSFSIAMVALLLFYGYEHWHLTFERNWKSDTIWGVRLWIPYLALPIGFGLFLLQLIADLVAVVLKIEKPYGLEDA